MTLAQTGGVKEGKRVLRGLLKAGVMTLDRQSRSDSLGSVRLQRQPGTLGPMINPVLFSLKATLENVAKLAEIVEEAGNPRLFATLKGCRELASAPGDVLQMRLQRLRSP
jgi:hypothetical protein